MRTIHKFEIKKILNTVIISMPPGANPLYAGEQEDKLYIWAIVNSKIPPISYKGYAFKIVGTGNLLSKYGRYLNTVQMKNGLIWHIFME